MPIYEYTNFDMVINYILDHEKPLALYYFGNDSKTFSRLEMETSSGHLT